ncbi:class I SAM-dependent methyltransferase [Haloarculaceae archaeon H-GB1-1]|nr:class I SAM-dependent methyltransferase [Haloarculaceae archaeon H-GB1-1]
MGDDRRSVKETYDRIADHFSKTREYPWPEIEGFVSDVDDVGVGLDLGCGNGRHLSVLAGVADRVVGVDASRPLLDEARERTASDPDVALVQGDAASIPLAASTVDVAVYIATLHHLPERKMRRRSLDELARVLSPGGRALVSAWSTEHDRFDATEGFDTTVDWTLPGGEVVPRFYHIYSPAEFEADLDASGLAVESVRVSSGNCYAEVTVD